MKWQTHGSHLRKRTPRHNILTKREWDSRPRKIHSRLLSEDAAHYKRPPGNCRRIYETRKSSQGNELHFPHPNPKKESTIHLNALRPISLCNRAYNIISKTIASRLKPLLMYLISSQQAGFVAGRQIVDNLILVQETKHSIKARRDSKMLLKLNLSKTTGKVQLDFLKETLLKFGFCQACVNWASNCLLSASFSVLINEGPSNFFQAAGGLWEDKIK